MWTLASFLPGPLLALYDGAGASCPHSTAPRCELGEVWWYSMMQNVLLLRTVRHNELTQRGPFAMLGKGCRTSLTRSSSLRGHFPVTRN